MFFLKLINRSYGHITQTVIWQKFAKTSCTKHVIKVMLYYLNLTYPAILHKKEKKNNYKLNKLYHVFKDKLHLRMLQNFTFVCS